MNIKEKWRKWISEADWNYLILMYIIFATLIISMILVSTKL